MDSLLDIILVAIAVFILIKIISAPIKLFGKIVLNAALGLVMLFLFNTVASIFGFSVEINFIHCAISGIFGIPGLILLIILKILL